MSRETSGFVSVPSLGPPMSRETSGFESVEFSGPFNGPHSRDTYTCCTETSYLSTRKAFHLQLLWTKMFIICCKVAVLLNSCKLLQMQW
jgi:hypothetical protein